MNEGKSGSRLREADGVRARLGSALTGAASAAAALATTEIVGVAIDRHRPTVVAAVASRLVVLLSGSLRGPAISVFGVHDKAALIVGIVLVGLGVGARIGLAGRRHAWIPPATMGVAAVLGVLAAWRDPLASVGSATIACLLGVAVGESTRRVLARAADHAAADPTSGGRRRFLAMLGASAVLATAAAVTGRALRAAGGRGRITALPPPRRATPVPPGESFAVAGLTPYITSNERFYRIDTAIFVPQIDVATWTLSIGGLVDHPRRFSYADLLEMPLVEEPVTLACVSNDVGGHLIGNARWLGVPLADLLGAAGVRPEGTQIVARSVDDFTVNVVTADALDGRVAMVALGMNGEPLPGRHGYPARLIVAGHYGYASATKWLSEIELTRREDQDSYWVDRGWDKDGPIRIQSRVDVPASGDEVAAGLVRFAGVAWAPPVGVGRVEVSIDRGPWFEATLGSAASPHTWVQWEHGWPDATAGTHICAVRATDRDGRLQVEEPSTPEPSGATGYHYRGFTVR